MDAARFAAAKKRYEDKTPRFIVDTPELASKYDVPIGTTILERTVPAFNLTSQDLIDDFYYESVVGD